MLVVSLCKPVIRKLKILGQGKLKSIGRTTKRGGQILKFQWEDKRREHVNHSRVADLFLDPQKTLETRILEQSVQIS